MRKDLTPLLPVESQLQTSFSQFIFSIQLFVCKTILGRNELLTHFPRIYTIYHRMNLTTALWVKVIFENKFPATVPLNVLISKICPAK